MTLFYCTLLVMAIFFIIFVIVWGVLVLDRIANEKRMTPLDEQTWEHWEHKEIN